VVEAPPPLPFQDLLEELRRDGIAVGVREHLALGRLLARYDGCSRGEFQQAVAALLATNRNEVRRIEAAFDRMYPEQEPGPTPRAEPRPRRWPRTAAVAIACVAAAVAVALLVAVIATGRTKPLDVPPPPVSGPGPTEKPGGPGTPCPPIPRLSTARADWIPAMLEIAGGLSAAVLLFDALRLGRRRKRRQTQKASHSRLAALPGPRDYKLALEDLLRRDERSSYAQLATALARAASDPVTDDEIDVDRTLRRSLREFPRLHLVARERRRPCPVVVLEDSSADMAPWKAKVAALVTALRRQALVVVRLYFQRDLASVSLDHRGPRTSLLALQRMHGDSPLVIVGCRAPADLASVIGWPKRVWLNPVDDPALWPDALHDPELPVAVLPMTRRGLLEVSRALRDPARRTSDHDLDPDLDADPADRPASPRLFAALLSLAPAPTFELAELLRARLFPQAPETLILVAERLLASGAGSAKSMAAVRASLARLDPDRSYQQRTRQLLLAVLDASEPPRDTAAHLRWQRDRAIQQVALGDPEGTRTLENLSAGPLADELRLHLEREIELGSIAALPGKPELGRIAREPTPDPGHGRAFAWPSLGAYVAVAYLVSLGAILDQTTVAQDMPYRVDAGLALSSTAPGTLTPSTTLTPPPATATLYRDGVSLGVVALGVPYQIEGSHCDQLRIIRDGIDLVSEPVRFEPSTSPFVCYQHLPGSQDGSPDCFRTAARCAAAKPKDVAGPCAETPGAYCIELATTPLRPSDPCYRDRASCDRRRSDGAICVREPAQYAAFGAELASSAARIDAVLAASRCDEAMTEIAAASRVLDDIVVGKDRREAAVRRGDPPAASCVRTPDCPASWKDALGCCAPPDGWIAAQRTQLTRRDSQLDACWAAAASAAFAEVVTGRRAALDRCFRTATPSSSPRVAFSGRLHEDGSVSMVKAQLRPSGSAGRGPIESCMVTALGGVVLRTQPPRPVPVEAALDLVITVAANPTGATKGLGQRCSGPGTCPGDQVCVPCAYDDRTYCRPLCSDDAACKDTGIYAATQCRPPYRDGPNASGLLACLRPDDAPVVAYYPCHKDADCDTGAMCINNSDRVRYCKPLCNRDADCAGNDRARTIGALSCKRIVANANPDAIGKQFCLASGDAGQPGPVIARIVGTWLSAPTVVLTIGAGSSSGIARDWTAAVLRGNSDQPLPGGDIAITQVDKTSTLGRTSLTADALLANPRVRLSPPSSPGH
jgi:uncharacterized protein with von Willebrand factor type A (vWA) domain